MPVLHNKTTGRDELVPNEQLQLARDSGDYDIPDDLQQLVTTPSGRVVQGSAADVAKGGATLQARPSTEAERGAAEGEAYLAQEYGTGGGKAIAGIGSAIDSAFLGLPGAALRAAAPGAAEEFRKYQQANPKTTTTTSIVGAVAPAIASAGSLGAATLTGRAARLGGALAEAGEGASLAARAGRAALGLGTEGVIQGAGSGVQALTSSADPITIERIASVLPSHMLYGGAIGAAAGAGGVITSHVVKSAAKGLAKGARAVEEAKAAAGAPSLADDIVKYHADGGQEWLIAEAKEGRKVMRDAQRQLRRAADEPVGLAENPKRVLDPLRREAKVMREAIADAPALEAKLAAEERTILRDVGEELATLPDGQKAVLTGKAARRYADWAGGAVPKAGVAAEDLARFHAALEAGEVQGARKAAIAATEQRLAANEALQARILQHAEAGPGPGMLAQIGEKAVNHYTMGAVMGAIPGGPLGAALGMAAAPIAKKLGSLVFDRLSMAGAEQAGRTSAALEAFMDVGTKFTSKAATVMPTRVLGSISYGPPPVAAVASAPSREAPLLAAYRARESEIRDQVTAGPDGRPMMKPAARRALAQRLGGVAAVSPQIADMMETIGARRIEFLASKLPTRPDIVAMQVGPERWQPSNMQMRSFARYAAAVEDPGAVEERLLHGTVTPEDAEAYRSVYPERFADFKRQISERLPELRASLPYPRRLALSIFTGIPVDPAMHPRVLKVLQASFTDEPGTEGGSAPPQAVANFGSVKTPPEPTPAQQRAQG